MHTHVQSPARPFLFNVNNASSNRNVSFYILFLSSTELVIWHFSTLFAQHHTFHTCTNLLCETQHTIGVSHFSAQIKWCDCHSRLTLPRGLIFLCAWGNWLKTYCQWHLQPLPDLHTGCVPQKFMQVKFDKGQNFPQFISFFLPCAQEKLWKCASKCTIKRFKTSASTKENII